MEDLGISFPSALKIGLARDGYRIRVEGRGASRESPAVLELFVVQLLDVTSGSVVVELSACEGLDVKFLDCLVDLHRHYGRGDAPRFAVVAKSESTRRLLARACPELLAGALEEGPEVDGEEQVLSPMEASRGDLDFVLMDWHRAVAGLGGPDRGALERFADRIAHELACC